MEKVKIPDYTGTETFSQWRKKAETAAAVMMALESTKDTKPAVSELKILVHMILAIQGPARDKVEDLEEMSPKTWSDKLGSLTEEEKKLSKDWIKSFLDTIEKKFRENNATEIRKKLEKWAKVPRKQVYQEIDEATATLTELEVWQALMNACHSDLKARLSSLKPEECTCVKAREVFKTLDLTLAKIYTDRPEDVPLSQNIQEFYEVQKNVAHASSSNSSGLEPVTAVVSRQGRGHFGNKNARSHSRSGPWCSFCRMKSHSNAECKCDPKSPKYDASFAKRRIKKALFTISQSDSSDSGPLDEQEDSDALSYHTPPNKASDHSYLEPFITLGYRTGKTILNVNKNVASKYQATSFGISIGGKKTSALADTGASNSAIGKGLALQCKGIWSKLDEPIIYKYAEGEGSVTHTFTAPIDFGPGFVRKWIKFYVFNNLICRILFGKDFLEESGAIINYVNHTVQVYGHKMPMLGKPANPIAHRIALLLIYPEISWTPMVREMVTRAECTQEQKQQLGSLLMKYIELFADTLPKAGQARVTPSRLGLKNDAIPSWASYNKSTPEYETFLQGIVDQMVKMGQAEELPMNSTSKGFNSRLRLVEKSNGTYRPTLNLMRVNRETLKDTSPLPRMDTMIDKAAGHEYYWKADFCNGFEQIPLDIRDRAATAFSTETKRYQLTTLPQGATNSPATFQRTVAEMIHGIEGTGNYVDDVIGACKSWESNMESMDAFLSKCRHHNFKLKPSKCLWGMKSIEFLGFKLSKAGKQPGTELIGTIAKLATPENSKEVDHFVGVANYFRDFIKDFAKWEIPLRDAIKEFKWDKAQQEAFQALKAALSLAPTLVKMNPKAQLEIHTDVSGSHMAATLIQRSSKGEEPIGYFSKKLTKSEQNYPTLKRELYGAFKSYSKWKAWTHMREVTIYTDHKPLVGLIRTNSDELDNPEATWVLKLSSPFISVKYKKGSENKDADGLSRLRLINMMINVGTLKQAQQNDEYCKTIFKELKKGDVEYVDAKIEDGILYRVSEEGIRQLVTPKVYVKTILEQAHNDDIGGHFSARKTFNTIKQHYVWKGMWNDIENFCKECHTCIQKHKERMKHGIPANLPNGSPWQLVFVDIVGPFKRTKSGNQWYILAIDAFTRNIEVRAIPDTTSKTVIKFLWEQIYLQHGAPDHIFSDNASYFTSQTIVEFYESIGVKGHTVAPYNPQGNGMAEKANGTFNTILRMGIGGNIESDTWDTHIPAAVFAYRHAVHDSTGYSPFFLEHLRMPRLPLDIALNAEKVETDKDIKTWLKIVYANRTKIHELARLNLIQSQLERNEKLSASQPPLTFSEGDLVWLHVDQTAGSRKFYWPWKGPFVISKKLVDQTYELSDVYSDTKIPKVNIRRLREFKQMIPDKNGLKGPAVVLDTPIAGLTDRSTQHTLPNSPTMPTIPTSMPIPIPNPSIDTQILIPSQIKTVKYPSNTPVTQNDLIPTPKEIPETPKKSLPSSRLQSPHKTPSKEVLDGSQPVPISLPPQNSAPPLIGERAEKALEASLNWLNSRDLSAKSTARKYRDNFVNTIKSASLAEDISKVLKDSALDTDAKVQSVSQLISTSSEDQWFPIATEKGEKKE